MSYGRLGVADLPATTNTVVYTAPSNILYSEVSVLILNNNAADLTLTMYVSTSVDPSTTERIENGVTIPAAGGSFERTNLILSPGEKIVINPSGADLTARVQGKEIIKT